MSDPTRADQMAKLIQLEVDELLSNVRIYECEKKNGRTDGSLHRVTVQNGKRMDTGLAIWLRRDCRRAQQQRRLTVRLSRSGST